jgi:hypothetical protein
MSRKMTFDIRHQFFAAVLFRLSRVAKWIFFSNRKSQLVRLAVENVGIFYDIWSHFTAIGYILCLFGIFSYNVVYFVVMWYIVSIKI